MFTRPGHLLNARLFQLLSEKSFPRSLQLCSIQGIGNREGRGFKRRPGWLSVPTFYSASAVRSVVGAPLLGVGAVGPLLPEAVCPAQGVALPEEKAEPPRAALPPSGAQAR